MKPALLLALAIVAEVLATAALRASDGFSRLIPSVVVVLGYAAAFALMAQILKSFPLGLTYAVWSGVGTALTAIVGWLYFRDAFNGMAVAGIALIILGVVVLNISGTAKH
ncbi:QacE family quaternary ammonium compound efflux SMR transporter [Deinococcus sp. HMF7620]|uniref:QacE family quaternary ammonium compound efflux SMR transporter n=1 Tax=Deinococcus arboris TaxID=2682977 RepID=A0A7C9I9M2_9DEIO|nr:MULTISPECIES: multidrug efflux SMR transporter [Deinococcus]MBZ9750178.1 multidrug efflux SMR transporter [Deinococcus betulae]MVN86326.1 QacE family quaternary ammonium compound efflux SMR transporter [Deinococcus arboris]